LLPTSDLAEPVAAEPVCGHDVRMARVISKDGTPIAYERRGNGPEVILVGGGLDDGAENEPLAAELSRHCTVVNYARRGRGGSGDTPPYAVEREIEDIAALITGSASLYGVSSGGALALRAAAAGLPVDKVGVYEVPFLVTDLGWPEYVEQLGALLAEDRRSDALALFMQLAGSTPEDIRAARDSPLWPGLEGLAPTLAYDAAVLGDGSVPAALLATIRQPTLVATGGSGFFDEAADAIAAAVPDARREVFAGESHVADPQVVAAALVRFLSPAAGRGA
jgi:pimeloyl-ACP methyl ester carboxylesterase